MLQEKYFLAASGLPLVSFQIESSWTTESLLASDETTETCTSTFICDIKKIWSTTLHLHSGNPTSVFAVSHNVASVQSFLLDFSRHAGWIFVTYPQLPIASFNQIQRNRIEVVSKYAETFGGGFLFVWFWYCIFSPLIVWKPMGTLGKSCLQQQFGEYC